MPNRRSAATPRRVSHLGLDRSLRLNAFLVVSLALLPAHAARQEDAELPVLRTETRLLDYEIGGAWHLGAWQVTPELPLDVLSLPRSAGPQRVVFRSPVDELVLEVAPGEERDFLVRLAGVGDCRTRLSALRRTAERVREDGLPFVTLPLTLAGDDRPYVEGTLDGSEPMSFLFDTGSNQLVLFRKGRAKLPELDFDGTTDSKAAGGTVSSPTSDGHRLDLGDLRWDHERVVFFDQDPGYDGILGYDLFTDRVVEIDPDAGEMRIHESLPDSALWTEALALRWEGNLSALPVRLEAGGEPIEAWPVLDSGATTGLALAAGFSGRNGLPGSLLALGTSRSTGLGPRPIEATVVEVPLLRLGPCALENVPVHVGRDTASDHVAEGLLGMDVLKRFRLWIDYPRNEIHLKPNALVARPFRRDYDTGRWRGILGGGLAAGVLLGLFLVRRARLRRGA